MFHWREAYQDEVMKNLTCQRIQADEIWAFCYAKQKNVPADKKGVKGYGDVWTWVAIDVDTKLVPTWVMGLRDADHAVEFMPAHISTSFVERQNLTMRMGMRRFTRLTNGFSKKLENLGHSIALHFMCFNFARRHQMFRVSPAMAAGVSAKLWTIEDLVALID